MAMLEEEGCLLDRDVEHQTGKGKRKIAIFAAAAAAAMMGFAAVAWCSQSEKRAQASPAKMVGLYGYEYGSGRCYTRYNGMYQNIYAGGDSSWTDYTNAKKRCDASSKCEGITCRSSALTSCSIRASRTIVHSGKGEVTFRRSVCTTTTTTSTVAPYVPGQENLVPASAPQMFLAFKLKNGNGVCLGASGDSVVAFASCPNTKQTMWTKYLDSVRSASSGKCITWTQQTLILDHCGKNDQRWHFDGSHLHAVNTSEKSTGFACASGTQVLLQVKTEGRQEQSGCSWEMPAVISSFDYVQTPGTSEVRVTSPCTQFNCGKYDGYLPKINAALLSGSRREECCISTCKLWSGSCPAGSTLVKAPGTVRGNDAGTCCKKSCSSMSCPDGQIKVMGSNFITSTTTADCCVKSCRGFSCPAGTRSILKEVPGNTREQCCYEVQADDKKCMWAKYTDYELRGHRWEVSSNTILYDHAWNYWRNAGTYNNQPEKRSKELCKMYGVVIGGARCGGFSGKYFYASPLKLAQKKGAVAWIKEPSCSDGLSPAQYPSSGTAFDHHIMYAWYLPMAFDFNVYRGREVTRTLSSANGKNPDMRLSYRSGRETETFSNGKCSAVIKYKCWRGIDAWVGKHEEAGCKYVSQLWSTKMCSGSSKNTFNVMEFKFADLDE